MIGDAIGPYEITAKLGEGGMGEVYRARDAKLDRDVALKVLPQAFTADPVRLARFEREARVLASLNHPNIGAIYGLEEAGDTRALVLELIEGPTLADRIGQGPIPLDEALAIARQIAEALEVAHEQGIVHRDLKPANVKVRTDRTTKGTVKVLDFGLAKALYRAEREPAQGNPSTSPTLTAMTSQPGVILGTAAYMSPEQARGEPVDKRADIWAFGVILYEMLTARRPFERRAVSDTLAAVLARDPELERLPAGVPEPVRRLLRRCLEKEPEKRLRDVAEGMLQLEEGLASPIGEESMGAMSPPPVAAWQRPASVAGIAAVAATTAGLLVWAASRPEPPASRIERFDVSPPPRTLGIANSDHDLAITRDGSRIVYTVGPPGRLQQIYVRALDQLAGSPLLEDWSGSAFGPFVSPDGAWVGFSDEDDDTLKKVSIRGGPAVSICTYEGGGIDGASWGPDDQIVFGTSNPSGLWRVPASGGEPELLTTVDRDAGEVNHGWPHVLLGGRAALFTSLTGSVLTSKIELLDLDTGDRRVLVVGGSYPRYSPTGHIVFAVEGTLLAVAFDPKRLRVTDPDPVPVLTDVMTKSSGAANFDLAADGSLVYVTNRQTLGGESLVWIDREGDVERLAIPPGDYFSPRISPDGRRIAVGASAPGTREGEIWIHELARGTETLLARVGRTHPTPLWSPDGRRLVFPSRIESELTLVQRFVDGPDDIEPLILMKDEWISPESWSEDGRTLLYVQRASSFGIGVLSLATEERVPELLIDSEADELMSAISPDGRWIAYASDESGRMQVYVQRFPALGDKQTVSSAGGLEPLWSRDGRGLFYRTRAALMRVPVLETEPTLRLDDPEVFFESEATTGLSYRSYDVDPDGSRVLMVGRGEGGETSAEPRIILVQNWLEELAERVPVR